MHLAARVALLEGSAGACTEIAVAGGVDEQARPDGEQAALGRANGVGDNAILDRHVQELGVK